jgi:hypothetical protein
MKFEGSYIPFWGDWKSMMRDRHEQLRAATATATATGEWRVQVQVAERAICAREDLGYTWRATIDRR